MGWTGDLMIACALRRETDGLESRLKTAGRFLTTGLGTNRTLQALKNSLNAQRPSLLIFTGTAGQLDPALRMGDVVCPVEWQLESGRRRQIAPDLLAFLRNQHWPIEGTGITVASPVTTPDARQELFRVSGARICDMESAAALQVAAAFKVACLAPKIVTDTAESGLSGFWNHLEGHLDSLALYLERLIACLEAR